MSDISHPQPPVPGGVRIGTVEREQAAAALAEHFAAGRLETDEFDARVRQAYLAKTAADLTPLFADLPDKQRFAPEPDRVRRDPGREAAALRTLVFVVAVLAAILWVALVRVPPLVFLPIVWLVLARRGFGRRSCRAW
ncbi:uncharacterized protein DUF1707 [Rhodococcus wratislaviensis]|uniref:Domain of uncharacterized function (DUF1707) n=2 Tax=Rhodococcus wratislaviensis TaxID=44752 RepID=A0AB38FJI0_RHOWR|nr:MULTISPECIES: DUF1707 domain-containing protein [Rhodococcus]REE73656.1 uncharacterized protein DUF1707 [Rhodococcus wratislaviensis]WAM17447.1 DUF1707 domain-containing protein [Rhodococcus sp. JS3073]GAF44685.1 hypothetical protein RW1_014_01480 [Rhodococcus wratislaviensis NBRC 100605]SPZ41515.1 Domain of uncharacterised function (DUF1707) [Rhodococcus wratislaviensis]